MKLFARVFYIMLTGILLLSGCSNVIQLPQEPVSSVVTSITVNYSNGPIQTLRHYTHNEKIRSILNYLRQVDAYGTPEENPETADGSDIHIVLYYSNDRLKVYRQKSDRYLKEGDAAWKKIDASKAKKLGYLLGRMESDALP